MFGKKDNQSNERVIYEAKPNLIFGCKKAILGSILLIIVLSISGPIIQYIGHMQVYLISRINLPLTRYTAIGVFVIMLIVILYIIWQIIAWYSKEYILTDSKIIVKSGVILNRKNYMPYSTIQDINTSQSIFARLFNIGSVSVYSAYDNNQIAIENISNPSKVEEIIFSNMSRNRGYYQDPRRDFYRPPQDDYRRFNQQEHYNDSKQDYYHNQNQNYYSDFQEDYYPDDYDDGVITPIKEEEQYQRRQYEYYPEDLNYNNPQRPKYEYEPYDGNLEHNINRTMANEYQSFDNSPEEHYDSYYDEVSRDYSRNNDYYNYEDSDPSLDEKESKKDMDESSEHVIKRHFDKFKK